MKVKMIFLLNLVLTGLTCITACVDDKTSVIEMEKYPLTAFAVQVNGSYYHGKIDQTTGRVEIGAITNPDYITGVDYTLMSDAATISPDPATFVGNWNKEEVVTVTTEDGVQKSYTIVLTQYDVTQKGVLFYDDFNVDGIPDETKWVLCPKASSDWNDEMSESYDQAYVENGNLILKAELVNGEYKAGGIKTEGKFDFTFGKVEVRARITRYPNGAFPAIWMMPKRYEYSGWPNCGEIDIMEHIKQESGIHQTLHTNYTYNLGNKVGTTAQTVCNFAEYNTYGVEWTSETLTFYVNGEKTFSYSNMHLENESELKQWPFTENASFYIILNMGLGDEGTWAGSVDDDNLPAVMEVDWVKVTKLDAE